ncbi:MAG: amidohydrolase family protein [Alphaproteobacteria bacterium]
MDIIDAQIHFGPGGIDQTLAAMDALGIKAALIDEFWGLDNWGPGYTLDNGAYRVTSPTAELASWLHPERFSYVLRVDYRDPEVGSLIRMARDAPHARAVRIIPAVTAEELQAFGSGAFEPIFAEAERAGIPLFIFIAGHVDLLAPYLKKFPDLQVIVDHCGMPMEDNVSFLDAQTPDSGPRDNGYFDQVLRLADHTNVALKWSHAQGMFGIRDYPFTDLWPYLRQAIDAFGANRIMWASDNGGDQTGLNWAELTLCMHEGPTLTESEREWVMGKTVQTLLNWT